MRGRRGMMCVGLGHMQLKAGEVGPKFVEDMRRAIHMRVGHPRKHLDLPGRALGLSEMVGILLVKLL
jgi:hypothetical protein